MTEDNFYKKDRTPLLIWLAFVIFAFIGLIKVVSWVYNLVNDLIEKL